MKLRNKIAAITAAAMLAFAGVGFAAWTFISPVSVNENISGKVTAAIEADNVKVYNGANEISTIYLIADAPKADDPLYDGTKLLAGNGLYWASDDQGANVITSLKLVGQVNQNDYDIAQIRGYTGTFTVSGGAITSSYISIDAAGSLASSSVVVNTPDGDCEVVYTLPTLKYTDVPEDVAEVGTMRSGLSVSAFSFSFAVTAIA